MKLRSRLTTGALTQHTSESSATATAAAAATADRNASDELLEYWWRAELSSKRTALLIANLSHAGHEAPRRPSDRPDVARSSLM